MAMIRLLACLVLVLGTAELCSAAPVKFFGSMNKFSAGGSGPAVLNVSALDVVVTGNTVTGTITSNVRNYAVSGSAFVEGGSAPGLRFALNNGSETYNLKLAGNFSGSAEQVVNVLSANWPKNFNAYFLLGSSGSYLGTLTAVPEPSSMLVLGLMTACGAGYGFRRKKLAA